MNLPLAKLETIWLADDDRDDCEFFEDTLKKIIPTVCLVTIPDGDELMKALDSSKTFDLLFLDINMPYRDGMDCLKEIRTRKQFAKLPIVIFSNSVKPLDIVSSYGYGATLYYRKPKNFTGFFNGLSELLNMNWNDPHTITSDQFINNRYEAYSPLPVT